MVPNATVLQQAETLMGTGNLSFWDALILAACVEGGVTTLYSVHCKLSFLAAA
jgi:predicted nucleic acid-binding protein